MHWEGSENVWYLLSFNSIQSSVYVVKLILLGYIGSRGEHSGFPRRLSNMLLKCDHFVVLVIVFLLLKGEFIYGLYIHIEVYISW